MEHATRDGEMVKVNVAGSVDEATAAGLMHPNCRHSLSAYQPGITRIPTATADPQGDADRQRLRAMERQVRKWKLRQDAALTPEAKKAAGAKVREWQGKVRDRTANTTAKRQRYREQVDLGHQPTVRSHGVGTDDTQSELAIESRLAETIGGTGSSTIALNSRYFGIGQRPAMLERIAEAVRTGYLVPASTDVPGLVTHEFGHVLDNQAPHDWRDAGGQFSLSLEDEVERLAASLGQSTSMFIASQLSVHGASDWVETIAEAFALAELAPPGSPLAALVHNRLMRALGR